MLYANGDQFIGAFKGGSKSGKGKYLFASGETVEGEWFGDEQARGVVEYINR